MAPILSIIIVTFNHEREIAECLDAIYTKCTVYPLEILIIDNHSEDHTKKTIEDYFHDHPKENLTFNLIKNTVNFGYTKAVNQGMKLANSQFILLLNPDTMVSDNAIDLMVQFLSNNPQTGAVAPQLQYPDGEIQPSCRRFPCYRYVVFEMLGLSYLFPRSKIFNGWKMGDFDFKSMRQVQQPQGSCLMIPQKVKGDIGFLDERFFLFFSDVDYCKRIRSTGFKIYFYPTAKVTHQKGSSIYRERAKLTWQSHVDFMRYFLKWYQLPFIWLLNLGGIPFLIVLGGLRWVFYRLKEWRSEKP